MEKNTMNPNSKIAPFYEPPPRKTSAEIISEARLAIKESQMSENSYTATSIKPLHTQRPFTPRDKERLLFGNKAQANRPPSSFSLKYLQTDTEIPTNIPENNAICTPNVTSNLKLNKNDHSISLSEISDNKIFNIGVKESLHKVKLPSLDIQLPKRKIKNINSSLDNLPEEYELNTRKAFSSPQERTDFNFDTPFGRPSKQQTLSQCILLGPQNLDKLFDNKQIMENSETLFVTKGYFNKEPTFRNFCKIHDSISVERTIEDVVTDLNSQQNNDEIVIDLLNELYDFMDKHNSTKIDSKTRIHVLKSLYKYVESQNEQILINIARIILALKVTGNNLSGVCKLIFKIAKSDKNDHLFLQKNVLELFLDALGRSSPLEDAEACVYGYGAVKFLTMNPKLLVKILSLGILPLMVLHIKIINNAKLDKNQMPDQTIHALFQLTGALRNMVSEETIYETFISCGAITQLCQAMELFYDAFDIISNISRILSTVSTNDCCCDNLAEYKPIYGTFVQIFDKYPDNEEMVVRLAYTLGNIVAKIDGTRVKFYNEPNAVKSLLNLWKIYLDKTLQIYSLKSENVADDKSNPEDVMIKIIRVIANVAINPEIGKSMNETYGYQLIDEFLKVLISNPFKRNDELVMSILSTLNNLSYYYSCEDENDCFHYKQKDIVEGIMEYTKSRNKECLIESMRILGNLSRSKITRSLVSETEIFQTLINLLEKVDITLLKTTIGVFVNLMSDNKSRSLFKSRNGLSKLITILQDYSQTDWLLGMLVCQVIWNYCIDTVDLYELITDSEIQQLLVVLADYLDEEKLFGITENCENSDIYSSQEYLIWEEFANVATNLLEKIEYFLDTCDAIKNNEDIDNIQKIF